MYLNKSASENDLQRSSRPLIRRTSIYNTRTDISFMAPESEGGLHNLVKERLASVGSWSVSDEENISVSSSDNDMNEQVGVDDHLSRDDSDTSSQYSDPDSVVVYASEEHVNI